MASDLGPPVCVPHLRERICHRCFDPLLTGPPAPPGALVQITDDRGQTGCPPSSGPGQRVAPKGMCDRCLFLLLLEAISELVPAAEVGCWMERPSHVLGGRTPRECIDARDFEPVFEAVWLYGPPVGPVS